jgi:Holliday junction resolvase RusA-like endonuclease
MRFTIQIPGKPVPQGSKRHVGNGIMVESNAKALYSWREVAVSRIEQNLPEEWDGKKQPVAVDVTFYFRRPKSHYGTGGNSRILKPLAPRYVTTRPDIDKLLRAVLDACTIAGVWDDDSQVVQVLTHKFYAKNQPATRLTLTSWKDIE